MLIKVGQKVDSKSFQVENGKTFRKFAFPTSTIEGDKIFGKVICHATSRQIPHGCIKEVKTKFPTDPKLSKESDKLKLQNSIYPKLSEVDGKIIKLSLR